MENCISKEGFLSKSTEQQPDFHCYRMYFLSNLGIIDNLS